MPSGWNATLTTAPSCAVKDGSGWPVRLSQIRTAPSPPADASRSPSGLNVNPRTSALTRMTSGSTLHSRMRKYHSHPRRSSGHA